MVVIHTDEPDHALNSDRVLCHFCFKPKKVTNESLVVDHAKKSQVLVSSVILLKTALDALPLLSKVPLFLCWEYTCGYTHTWHEKATVQEKATSDPLFFPNMPVAKGCKKFSSVKYLQVSLWKWEIWSY